MKRYFELRYIDTLYVATHYAFCICKSNRTSVAEGINQGIVMDVIRVTQ